MLDLQRQRSSYRNKEGVFFARGLLIAHLAVGLAAIPLLIFQEQFKLGSSTLCWYLGSLLLMFGMGRQHQWARYALGSWFMGGGIAALAFLIWFLPPVTLPTSPDIAPPPIGKRLLPLWFSTVALGYLFTGALVMLSRRLARATQTGFALWEAPRLE